MRNTRFTQCTALATAVLLLWYQAASAGIVRIRVMSDEVLELMMAEGTSNGSCTPNNFTIKGSDGRSIRVARAGRRSEPFRMDIRRWPPRAVFHQFFYLQLASPMRKGVTYTVTMKRGVKPGVEAASYVHKRKLVFKARPWKGAASRKLVFDPDRTICYAIKHNQVGYRGDVPHKYAYVGRWLGELGAMSVTGRHMNVELVNAKTRAVVWKGRLRLRRKRDKLTQEDVYDCDFGSVTGPGSFYLRGAALGRSESFKIGPDALSEALYVAARGFYHQRCGIAYEKQYTRWSRPVCHVQKYTLVVNTKNARPFFNKFNKLPISPPEKQIPARFLSGEKIRGVIGGWHDAADYDRNTFQGHVKAAWYLMAACEMFPERLTDNQLNIPESGNGTPDLLDEADWGMKLWLSLVMRNGAIRPGVEARRHPGKMAHEDKLHYFTYQPAAGSNFRIAAGMALISKLLKPFNAGRAARYLKAARGAYAWAARQSEEAPDHRAWAAAELFKATGEKKYEADFKRFSRHASDPRAPLAVYRKYDQTLAAFAYSLCKNPKADAAALKSVRAAVLAEADRRIGYMKLYGYRSSKDPGMPITFGSGTTGGKHALAVIVAYGLTRDRKYLETLQAAADYTFGSTGLGICWMTGVGARYPCEPQSIHSSLDGIEEPVPGIVLYGPTRPPGWLKRGWMAEAVRGYYPKNVGALYQFPYLGLDALAMVSEYTVQGTQGPTVLLTAALAPKGDASARPAGGASGARRVAPPGRARNAFRRMAP